MSQGRENEVGEDAGNRGRDARDADESEGEDDAVHAGPCRRRAVPRSGVGKKVGLDRLVRPVDEHVLIDAECDRRHEEGGRERELQGGGVAHGPEEQHVEVHDEHGRHECDPEREPRKGGFLDRAAGCAIQGVPVALHHIQDNLDSRDGTRCPNSTSDV